MGEKVVIAGGGVAGGSAAVQLREAGFEITLISRDPVVYSKMTLSYALKNRVTSIEPYVVFKPEELGAIGVKFVNDNITMVDSATRTVYTEKSGRFEYDILVLATGGRVSAPRIDGIELEGVYTFLAFEDMINLSSVAIPGRRAVIIGAGMIGVLVADALHALGLDVTMLDILPYPLMTAVEEPISKIMLNRLLARGVRFLGSCQVERIEGTRRVERLVLADGTKIPADIVVISTGVTANVPSGLEHLKQGPGGSVLTDEYFRTKDPSIYAIGDCASSMDYITGKQTYRPLGIIASYEAKLLPKTMKGLRYSGFIPYQVEEAFGYYFMRLGLNGLEARRLGIGYSTAKVEYRAPGVGISRSIVLYERGSGRIIGWQSIGSAMVSYKSRVFESAIRNGWRLENLQERNMKIVCEEC